MQHDSHGLTISTSSAEAAAAFHRCVESYLKARVDLRDHLAAMLKADPEFGFAQCLKGYFVMLLDKQAAVPVAAEAAKAARNLIGPATQRERMHVDALDAWVAGDLRRALAVWEEILLTHPTDVLAFRFAHYKYFWTGRRHDMLASVERIAPKWGRELSGYGPMQGCLCFAHEECGNYDEAERAGRLAIDIDPADLWAAHGVAHVMEMQGRARDGIAWLSGLERHWEPGNQLRHHLWWHRALYHFEQREFDEVLSLYDRQFRNLASPLTQSQPDYVIDIQNAASMLFRLERQGVDVGNRWHEIADKAEKRVGDCLSAFTVPHWIMALAAAGRDDAASSYLDGMRAFGETAASTAADIREIALPVSQAVLAHRRGEYAKGLEFMRPIVDQTYRLGGSHAQHDVLRQLFLDCAMRVGSDADIRLALAGPARFPAPVAERVGYAEAARRFPH
jgi:tetratricopeptide (TPR) repeat protein